MASAEGLTQLKKNTVETFAKQVGKFNKFDQHFNKCFETQTQEIANQVTNLNTVVNGSLATYCAY